MMDTDEDRPLESPGSITTSRSYFFLKRKLTDEAVGKKGRFRVVTLTKDNKALVPDQLHQILALTCEANVHLTNVMYPCQEYERGPGLGTISSPDRCHE